jgi:delta 1-pyrroline-5-carboxylate dehydrogenase
VTQTLALAHSVAGQARRGPVAFEQRNPAVPDDLAVLGPEADAALIAEASATAHGAIAAMETAGIEARADALARIGRTLSAEADRIGLLIARETGKTLGDSKSSGRRASSISSRARRCATSANATRRRARERWSKSTMRR